MARDEYFNWLCDLICSNRRIEGVSYEKLLRYLYAVDFEWIIPMDEDRADEGLALRYRYYMTTGKSSERDEPCSVLELMISLAIHCEVSIMDDPTIGDRTSQWFWQMIRNMGLGSMTDARFDIDHVDDVIYKFLNREYEADGRGGLFRIKDCPRDVRDMEIWHQLCYFLNTIT